MIAMHVILVKSHASADSSLFNSGVDIAMFHAYLMCTCDVLINLVLCMCDQVQMRGDCMPAL